MTEQLSLSQPISMTHNVKPLRMREESQDYKLKESLTSQQQLPLLTECKKKRIRPLQSMIWEEEHSIFPFLRFPKESLKSRLPTEILHVEVKTSMELSKDSYSKNSKSNQASTYQRTRLPIKDLEKLQKKQKLSFLNRLKLKSIFLSLLLTLQALSISSSSLLEPNSKV